MDKIYLKGLTFYGYHGLFAEENKLGQRFIVDAILHTSLKQAGESDKMEDSIDYGAVYTVIDKIITGPKKHLIESLAEEIASSLLSSFDLMQACTIKVIKPDPPIPGYYESVAVEIYRERT